MKRTMDDVLTILKLLFPLIQLHDPKVFEFLTKSGVFPAVATPWLLTWLAHNLEKFSDVARVFDLFLVSPPCM